MRAVVRVCVACVRSDMCAFSIALDLPLVDNSLVM